LLTTTHITSHPFHNIESLFMLCHATRNKCEATTKSKKSSITLEPQNDKNMVNKHKDPIYFLLTSLTLCRRMGAYDGCVIVVYFIMCLPQHRISGILFNSLNFRWFLGRWNVSHNIYGFWLDLDKRVGGWNERQLVFLSPLLPWWNNNNGFCQITRDLPASKINFIKFTIIKYLISC
jgi:hypothetical protein